MSPNPNSPRWLNSRAYLKARAAVASLLSSPKALLNLLDKAAQKSDKQSPSVLGRSFESVKVLIRLTTAFARGDYRDVSLENMALIVAALLYFVMPLDALPDFIMAFGLTDDVALLAWTWSKVKDEVERFLAWELENEKMVQLPQSPAIEKDQN